MTANASADENFSEHSGSYRLNELKVHAMFKGILLALRHLPACIHLHPKCADNDVEYDDSDTYEFPTRIPDTPTKTAPSTLLDDEEDGDEGDEEHSDGSEDVPPSPISNSSSPPKLPYGILGQ